MPPSAWSLQEVGALRKVEHNFLPCSTTAAAANTFCPQLQFPFSWLLKKPIDDMSTGVYRLSQDGKTRQLVFII